MAKDFSNLEDTFRRSFDNWEADYSPSELNSSWSQVSGHLPFTKPVHSPGHHVWGTGKILGIGGTVVAVATATVLLYHALVPGLKPQFTPVAGNQIHISADNRNIDIETADQEKSAAPFSRERKSDSNGAIYEVPDQQLLKQPYTNADRPMMSQPDNFTPEQGSATGLPQNQGNKSGDEIRIPNVLQQNVRFSESILCQGEPVRIDLNSVATESNNIRVNWGDGTSQQAAAFPVHAFSHPGSYLVRLTSGGEELTKEIKVLAAPKASFRCSNTDRMLCRFRNQSENAVDYVWLFGDSAEGRGFEVEHQYHDTGRYFVRLIAFNSGGCSDTIVMPVYVSARVKPLPDNFLSPNGDGMQDELIIPLENEDMFSISISDVNGRLIFTSNDKNSRWNGTDQFGGQPCPVGTYYYILKYKYKGESQVNVDYGSIFLKR